MSLLEKIATIRRTINDSSLGQMINHSLPGLVFERTTFYVIGVPLYILDVGVPGGKTIYETVFNYPTNWSELHTHTSPLYTKEHENDVKWKGLGEAISSRNNESVDTYHI